MREEHFYFLSNDGKTQLHAMRWLPECAPCAVVQLVHGMSEYIARYRDFAQYLAGQGIVVVGYDHLGHGGSVQSDGDLGYFAEHEGDRCLVRDMHRLYHITKKQYGAVPYVMLGHSMGSFLTRKYLCCYGSGLDGAILCGTGNHTLGVLSTALALCRGEAKLFGWRYRSRVFAWMTADAYNVKFRPARTDFDWLCRDREVVDAYLADEKCGFPFTLNGYYALFLTLYKINRKEYLERMPRSLPVLFIAGDKDPVGNFGAGVRDVVAQFRKIGMQDVTCTLYPEDRHELLNETDKYEVYADVVSWMKQKHLAGIGSEN